MKPDVSGKGLASGIALLNGGTAGSTLTARLEAQLLRTQLALMAALRELSSASEMARTAHLTGLANRRAAEDALVRMVGHARRSREQVAVVLLDIDHFKHVNDEYGHECGDATLSGVAATLRASFRAADLLARWGGEEFVLALPDTGVGGAQEVVRKLRCRLTTLCTPLPTPVTVSVGIAVFPDHAAESEELLRLADDAMYLAKERGRDRVEVARREPMETARRPIAATPSWFGVTNSPSLKPSESQVEDRNPQFALC